jgi:hypothetical protein
MWEDRVDYEALLKRVEESLAREKRNRHIRLFAANAAFFLTMMALVWLVFFQLSHFGINDSQAVPLILLSVGWAIGLMMHAITVFGAGKKAEAQLREQIMGRELQHEIVRLAKGDAAEKPKRAGRLALSDDGEVIEVEAEEEPQRKAKPVGE